jgi:hypothetical protein
MAKGTDRIPSDCVCVNNNDTGCSGTFPLVVFLEGEEPRKFAAMTLLVKQLISNDLAVK